MNLDDSYILLRVDDEKVIDFDFNDDCKVVTVKLGSDMIQEVSLSYEDIYSIFKLYVGGDTTQGICS
mgnify:CR=1 FL=1